MELHASKKIVSLLSFTFLFFIQYNVLAQNSILHRKISLYVENKTVDDLLEIVSKKGRFYFSYNSSILSKYKIIPSIKENNITIQSLLKKILGDDTFN